MAKRKGGRQYAADVAVYAPLAGRLYESIPGPAGGAEVQTAYLAQSLAGLGFRVVHIVSGTDAVPHRNGVRVVQLPRSYGNRGLPRRRAILASLRDADAAVYIQRSAGFETGTVGLFAQATGRRFVFSSSSKGDLLLDRRLSRQSSTSLDEWPTRLQYLIGLYLANAVVVQTNEQRVLAQQRRGVEPRVIRSFCAPVGTVGKNREAFLWIGGLLDLKEPLAYVELARRVPEVTFWMIGGDRGPRWAELAARVRAIANEVPNLYLLPRLGRKDVLSLYDRAVAVVNTSWVEGFPNTFLEGWARGRPALSLRVDPDGVIERNALGAVAHGSLDKMEAATRELWHARDSIDPAPLQRYVARFHDPNVIGTEWAALIQELQ